MKQTFFSPAKVNLFFRILKKRDDGFHEIATLMQALSLGDWISVEVFQTQGQDRLTVNDPNLGSEDSNLIMKALKLFKEVTKNNDFHAHISLDKRIPMMAGLGGGSSNAATTLWALTSLLKASLNHSQLLQLGAILGSDVPFFFSEGIAKCFGRGEMIEKASKTFIDHIWLIKPKKLHLSTPIVYKHCIPNIYSKSSPDSFFESFCSKKPQFINELEFPVFKLVPKLKELKNNLFEMGFTDVMMTGSGSCFLALGNPKDIPSSLWVQKVSPIFRSKHTWYTQEKADV